MRRSQPTPLDKSISSVISQLGFDTKLRQCGVLEVWPEIVGERIAGVASAVRITDGKLIVRVTRSTWRNELVFLKKELITRINEQMKEEIVKDIIFR